MNTTRKDLCFSDIVQKEFSFLEHDFGLSLDALNITIVRYRSPSLAVNVYHGRKSYEIGFELCKVDEKPEICLSLPTILRAVVPSYKGQTFFQASDRHTLEHCINIMASLVKSYCIDLFKGNVATWKVVKKIQDEMTEEVTNLYTIKPIKIKALEAWQRKDYREVVSLYESVMSNLDDIERRRLDYSRKRMDKS